MFLKITRSGPRQYLQLVEAFRDDAGKAKHRTLVTLGRLDQLTDSLDSVISGLLKVTGRPDFLNAPLPAVEFESARALGNVWALNELWESLGFGELRRVFRKTRHSIDVEALVRVMVFNRLCDPESKLGVLRWLETVAMPGIEVESITHPHLLRSSREIVQWVRGTTLNRFQKQLPTELFERFVADYEAALLAEVGDRGPFFFPFRRILLWGRLPG